MTNYDNDSSAVTADSDSDSDNDNDKIDMIYNVYLPFAF